MLTPVRLVRVTPQRQLELLVERGRLRCISAAARTARSASSSWTAGQAEDGHDRVADELLDRPAVALAGAGLSSK